MNLTGVEVHETATGATLRFLGRDVLEMLSTALFVIAGLLVIAGFGMLFQELFLD